MATPPTSSVTSSKNNKKITRILIVDDEYDVAISLKVLLEDEGYDDEKEKETRQEEEQQDNNTTSTSNRAKEFEVDVFNDPEVVLSNFKAGQYDLLLLGIVMPKMYGFKLYEKMKNIDDNVKVCFITVYMVNYDAVRNMFPCTTQI